MTFLEIPLEINKVTFFGGGMLGNYKVSQIPKLLLVLFLKQTDRTARQLPQNTSTT
jgi:hypothetical protein